MRRQLILFSSVVASLVLTNHQVEAGEFVFEPAPASAERIDPDKLSEVEIPSMDLARSLAHAAKVGTKVRTAGGMACFKADEHEYRCAKLHANSGRSGLIVALDVDEPAKQVLDQYCFTIARAWRDGRCAFNATFVVARRGMNQMEDTFVYLTEQMKLTHWSKY